MSPDERDRIMAKIKLDVHVCAMRNTYTATFATERQAIEFIGRKSATCAFWTRDDSPMDGYPELMEVLFPTCEHGLSASLCMGPAHYATDEEIMMGY
jgi:hypothetical protein